MTGSLGGSGLHEQKSPAAAKLSPSSAMDVEEELPLQDEVSEDSGSPETTGRGNTGSYSKVRTASGKPKPDTTARPKPPARPASPPSLPSPGEVGAMLIEQPHLLEPGLSVEQDGSGKSVGARMSTDVGQIDLLARDDAGGLVVVMVPAPDEAKDVVGDVLRRIGWVRKHRAKKGQDVRGVVIMAEVPDEVAYAATAVSDTVSFKTFRLSVAFDEVDL